MDTLSEVERTRLDALIQTTLIELEYEFGQMMDGNLPEDRDSVCTKWRQAFGPDGLMGEGGQWHDAFVAMWPQFAPSMRADFVEFWDREVMSPE